VDALRLPQRARIGQREILVVDKVRVVHARLRCIDLGLPPAVVVIPERVPRACDFDSDSSGAGRPHTKTMHSEKFSSK
jgi:hypothetical protein